MRCRSAKLCLFRAVLTVLFTLALSGCLTLPESKPVSVIAPQIDPTIDPAWPTVEWALVIQRPQADQMRDSDRLLVRVAGSRLQPWPSAVWLDSMPDMLRTLLIQGLEDSGRIETVGRPGSLRAQHALLTEIRRFEAVDDGGADLAVELAVQARLVRQATGEVLGASSFSRRVQSQGKELDRLVVAFESALAALIADLVGWVLIEGNAKIGLERVFDPPDDGGENALPQTD